MTPSTIKIFCVYHKDIPCIIKDNYTPIFVGSALYGKQPKISGNVHYVTDDMGDNISELNKSLNEITATYWIWKHYKEIGDPDCIGLTHYRRFFVFNESYPMPPVTWLPHSSSYCFNTLKDVRNVISTDDALDYFKEGYSILATRKYDAILLGEGAKSCRQRFYQIAEFDKHLYDRMETLVLTAYPDYEPEIQALRAKASHYLFNMFVMKREVFFAYCDFIFPILFELNEENSNTSSPTVTRAPGFLAEFLTSMFISHELRVKGRAVKELNTAFINCPEAGYGPISPGCIETGYLSHSDRVKIHRYDLMTGYVKKLFPDHSYRKSFVRRMLRLFFSK